MKPTRFWVGFFIIIYGCSFAINCKSGIFAVVYR